MGAQVGENRGNGFLTDASGSNGTQWVRYHHLLRSNLRKSSSVGQATETVRHQLITDVMGYNSGRFSEDPFGFKPTGPR